jgi:hypothetical protein
MTTHETTAASASTAAAPSTGLFHHEWTRRNQDEPAGTAIASPLLDLHRTSDVDPVLPEQIDDAHAVLGARRHAGPDAPEVIAAQRRVVERFLAGRRRHFGPDDSAPLPEAGELAASGCDTFLVMKYMDEAPHIADTVHSILAQRDIDPRRVVLVAVDNNSTDGSDRIVAEVAEQVGGPMRVIQLRQTRAGAGNAARLGVDRCVATVLRMCEIDGNWSRLQQATIAVTDGDTVYHPRVLAEVRRTLDERPDVDGVMPFLTYKFTAALRLFPGHRPLSPAELRAHHRSGVVTEVPVSLRDIGAHDTFPRAGRRVDGETMMLLSRTGGEVRAPLVDEHPAGRFAVLRDPAGALAYAMSDRRLVLDRAPVSGVDAALLHLESGAVGAADRWRWHALVGHDLFLYWMFAGMGVPEEIVYPDTSDALKTFRVWAAAIGGQHQLRRPDLRIATGSDYQSGRILQAVGATVCLAPAEAFAETEVDRLVKMVRNLTKEQSVFYGATRSSALERATGMYVHMTRIQDDLEAELRTYPDHVFESVVFPERVLFPLRWLLQNAVRFAAHEDPAALLMVRDRVLVPMFGAASARAIEHRMLGADLRAALLAAPHHARQDIAEGVAEDILREHYPTVMDFYVRTLVAFFAAHDVSPEHYAQLLDGVSGSRNAILTPPPDVDPRAVWSDNEFEIDEQRGQVLRIRPE